MSSGFGFPPLAKSAKIAFVVCIGIWVLELVLYYASRETLSTVMQFGLLFPEKVLDGYVFQLATYMFFHDINSPMHVLMNMLLVYFFAHAMEDAWGLRRTLLFMFGAGVAGGVMVVLFTLLGAAPNPTLGFSGAALGLLAAFCIINAEASILLFFIIPIKAKYILPLTVGIDFLIWITPSSDVSFPAHLGGILFAFIAITGIWKPSRLVDEFKYRKAKAGLKKYYKDRERDGDNVVKGPWLH